MIVFQKLLKPFNSFFFIFFHLSPSSLKFTHY